MDIRVVNLDRATDRRERAEAQLRALGLEAKFVSAVDGQKHDLREFTPFLTANPFLFRPLMLGEIGCFASHYRLWQECVASRRPMLILEDDCLLQPGIAEVVAALPVLLGTHAFLRLGGSWPRTGKTLRSIIGGGSIVRLDEGPLGTVAYAIAPKAAERLIRHAAVWNRPVDAYVDAFWVHGILPLAVQPYPVMQWGFSSTTSDSGRLPPEFSDRVRWARRRVARLSRKLFRHVHPIRRLLFKLGPAWHRS